MKRVLIGLAVLLMTIGLPAQALAFVPRAGGVVTISEAIRDDVYAAGQSVTVTAEIDGDLAAAGQDVIVAAPVTGAVLAAGANVDLNNRVDRSVRAMGGRINIRGTVGTDAILLGGSVRLWDTSRVERDLVAAGGRIRQAGAVGRDAVLNGGRVTIAGTIGGSVRVEADELIVLPEARISGKLTYSASQDADIRAGAQIGGGVERIAQPTPQRRVVSPATVFGFKLIRAVMEIVWLLVLGFVGLAISTRGVLAVADRIRRKFWMSALGGFVLVVVVPVAAVVLFVTIIGIPIGGIALLLYLATLYPAKVFTAAWLGDWVVGRLRRGAMTTTPSPYLTMLVGVMILGLLIALPIAGWAFRFVALLVGFGALWAKLWEARSPAPASASPP